ncbi:class I SAM-dependent methyltransferase [Hyphomonas sp. WL0036]|uniref:class I SAM-dependent methyltransferase n=1 Tax=Hyphomonas sediminis TaxID=2866160 RepID=UPI001C8086FF|nr:class I SAM-dependent methyltransferase [Hyphomonas sediminis]MBY9066697.1 class I SAM-dependent methyltransferase [Hyphomonas sediminis]
MSMKTETRLLIADDWEDYALLDSGHLQKLERFGSQTVIRPDPQAFWEPARPVQSWKADARFVTKAQDEDGAGNWEILSPRASEAWQMRWNGLTFTARRTAFRHMGVFQEHSVHWRFAQEQIRAAKRPLKVLNLFGYTGMMSLACAAAGAEVVHLDASPKSNGYGKDNQSLSGLDGRTIRWIADDAMKFVAREIRRGSRYDGIVLDPPKFGRGPKNETWRFEESLPELLDGVRDLLSDEPQFVIATAYAVRLSYLAVAQALGDRLKPYGGIMEMGEMALPQQGSDRLLPTALYARWRAG